MSLVRGADEGGNEALGPLPGRKPRSRLGPGLRTWLSIVAMVVVLGVGLLVLLSVLPVRHQLPETFRIGEYTGPGCEESPTITSPADGSLKFSWTTNDSRSVTVYVNRGQAGPGEGLTVYSATGTNGSGDIQILTGYYYGFDMCSPPTTVQVTGTLSYDAPILRF
jgi:hypothetical protein